MVVSGLILRDERTSALRGMRLEFCSPRPGEIR
jgi:hypothetical protein